MAAQRPARPRRRSSPAATPAADDAARARRTAEDLGEAVRAYDAGDLERARGHLASLDDAAPRNADLAAWLRGMVALRTGAPDAAARAFARIDAASRLAPEVPWRLADCAWARGDQRAAAAGYEAALRRPEVAPRGDAAVAWWRIAAARARQPAAARAALRRLVLEHADHPLAEDALARLAALGAPPLSPADRVERARHLTSRRRWDDAVAELALVGDDAPDAVRHARDLWLGETLFQMRRRYAEAGGLLLGAVPFAPDPAEAMFHGARALSRADRDDEAIRWYREVVARYPSSRQAPEAAYLAGWLEFNRGRYREAVAPLEAALRRFPRSRWAGDARWFLGLAHYLLGEWDAARGHLAQLGRQGGALEGGKGRYWLARIDERGGGDRLAPALDAYREVVRRHPFSWYALLARARLGRHGVRVGPFGEPASGAGAGAGASGHPASGAGASGVPLDAAATGSPDASAPAARAEAAALAQDPALARVDELLAAGLGRDAGEELERVEARLVARHGRAAALPALLERYRRAGNFRRPWMIAVSRAAGALDRPALGADRAWWERAYPRAFRELVERHQGLGHNPEGYLYAIMRKESGFDPHDVSYADAQGLLQMIPATTRRVAATLGLPYDDGKLFDPEFNVQTGSWYIGRLLEKFGGQIPLGAGAFNSGPRPVMKWLDQLGDRELDELVELVPYTQTREYMKKVTENFARYRYLYAGEVYVQPLVVDRRYAVDALTF